MESISCTPIGVIRTRHKRAEETPVQPAYARGIPGQVEVFEDYEEGLDGIEGFSHVYLVYAFDRASGEKLTVVPFMSDTPRGVFATRSPQRPNRLGMSLVRLVRREGRVLHVEDVDILDGTPLLDIKPYVRRLDTLEGARSGWREDVDEKQARVEGLLGHRGDDDEARIG